MTSLACLAATPPAAIPPTPPSMGKGPLAERKEVSCHGDSSGVRPCDSNSADFMELFVSKSNGGVSETTEKKPCSSVVNSLFRVGHPEAKVKGVPAAVCVHVCDGWRFPVGEKVPSQSML